MTNISHFNGMPSSLRPASLLALLILSACMRTVAQSNTFCRTYTGSHPIGWDWFEDVATDTAGALLAAGPVANLGGWKMGLVKLQADGSLIWDNAVGGTSVLGQAHALLRLSNDRLFVAGNTIYAPVDPYLACFSQTGNLLWDRTYRVPVVPLSAAEASPNILVAGAPGSLILAGVCRDSVGSEYDALIMSVDTVGEMQWVRTFGQDGWGESAEDVVHMSDGGYVIVGKTHEAAVPYGFHTFVFKLDANANLLWSWKIQFGYPSSAVAAVEGPGGDVIVGGTVGDTMGSPDNDDLYWMRLSGSGVVIEAYRYGTAQDDMCMDLIMTTDSGYALTGTTQSDDPFPALTEGVLVKTGPSGLFDWGRRYHSATYTMLYTMAQTDDQGYLLGGQVYFDENANHDAILIRTDSLGNTCPTCNAGTFGASSSASTTQVAAGILTIPGYTMDSIMVQESGVVTTDLCAPLMVPAALAKVPRLFPQPADAFAYIRLEGIADQATMELYDARGIRMAASHPRAVTEEIIVLDTGNLPTGLYHVLVKSGGRAMVLPLVVQH